MCEQRRVTWRPFCSFVLANSHWKIQISLLARKGGCWDDGASNANHCQVSAFVSSHPMSWEVLLLVMIRAQRTEKALAVGAFSSLILVKKNLQDMPKGLLFITEPRTSYESFISSRKCIWVALHKKIFATLSTLWAVTLAITTAPVSPFVRWEWPSLLAYKDSKLGFTWQKILPLDC